MGGAAMAAGAATPASGWLGYLRLPGLQIQGFLTLVFVKTFKPISYGRETKHVFLLLDPVEVYTADLTLEFYCLKTEKLLLCADWTLR